jgi:RND superfamily putative drug exporter
MVQDFIGTPSLREFMTSKDNKAWVLPVGLTGALGTPESYAAFTRVSEIVRETTAASALDVHLAGPAATVADLTVAGQRDRLPIEIAIAVMVLLVLLVVYRNPVAMLLPLIGIGTSLVIAQSAVAGFSELTGLGVSNQAIILLSAMIAGAGTDYAVFLISRYHDYVRRGDASDDAVRHALTSVGKVITASAATIGLTFLAISFARMGVFSTVGVACAIGVGVAFLASVTLLPAILTLVGRRGWINPRRELTARRRLDADVHHHVADRRIGSRLDGLAGLETAARGGANVKAHHFVSCCCESTLRTSTTPSRPVKIESPENRSACANSPTLTPQSRARVGAVTLAASTRRPIVRSKLL